MVSIENILSNLSYNIFNQSEIETLESKIITKAEEDRFRYYIYCLVRNRLIQLTPEEVIRQLYLHKLTYTYKYPKELLRVEYPIQFGSDNTKRADIVILNKEHPDSIDIIIEVKNPEIQYGKEQLKSYCNATGSPIGIWVNGNEIRFFKRNEPNYFLEIDNIPIYENSLNSFDKPRFEHIPKSDGIEYKMLLKDVEIDFDYWNNFMDDENNGIFILISEMLDNGQVEKKEKSILIPYEEISNLNSIEQKILGLPTKYPYKIRIQANGAIHENNFTYKWGFYEHEFKELPTKRCGGILLSDDNNRYLLSSDEIKLCNELDKFNSIFPENKTLNSNFLFFAKIKELAIKTNSILDTYLNNENVILPKNINLDINVKDDVLEISPEIENIEKITFEKKFDRFPKVQNPYNLDNSNGEKTRVIFSSEQEEELKKIKINRRTSGEKKQRLIEYPQEIFNPDIIDLDRFSERVKDIGFYRPKFYPFVSNYKSEWIPGFIIETSPENRKKIEFKKVEVLETFKKECEKSVSENLNFVKWEGVNIPIAEAKEIITLAEIQLSDTSQPISEKIRETKKVLIIKENIEELEHYEISESSTKKSIDSFIHRYTQPPFLREEFKILEHQQEGIAWLQSLSTDGHSGALLADDMGLGKTLQVLGFIQWHNKYKNKSNKPYLIVAPVSLLENWESEFYRFFKDSNLKLIRGYGTYLSNKFGKLTIDELDENIPKLQKKHIFLTTYETIRLKQFTFCAIDWAVTVLDEAQKVKTPGTLITNAIKAIKSDFKIASTGTPVENTLVDLWCIMDFAIPGLLGSAKEFAKEFQNPLKQNDVDLKELGEKLRKRIDFYIKRRMKIDTLTCLPKKQINTLKKLMPIEQEIKYKEVLDSIKTLNSNDSSSKNIMLQIIYKLRNISDHPYILDEKINEEPINNIIQSSAKLQITIETLNKIKSLNEKAIIFTDRKEVQKMLCKVLSYKYNFIPSIINGDTPATTKSLNSSKESRQQAIDKFQNKIGFNLIIMSPIATGFGLNITKANHVIHYSRHWNPAKEEQATDRVYRIGQEKDVQIYIPMSISNEFKSFDIVINELLERKKELASASLFPTQKADISLEDIYKLF